MLSYPFKTFKGAEAENGLILQDSNSTSHNFRGNLLRVVSKLLVLNAVGETDEFELKNTIQDNSCLTCFQTCNNDMYYCLSCETISTTSLKKQGYICSPCKIKCHPYHKVERIGARNDKSKQQCECNHINN